MGLFDSLREGIFRVRMVPKNTADDITDFTSKEDSTLNRMNEAIDAGKRIDLTDLSKLTSLKGDRNTKYTVFEEMVADGRIAAAVEMYANDTVQYDAEGRTIWVESPDSDVAKYANKLLNDLNIPNNLWSYAYCMWLYGDVYLETFQSTSNSGRTPSLLTEPTKLNQNILAQKDIKGAKLERYIEKVANPAEIYDLQYKGKTSGYIKSRDNIDNTVNNNTYTYTNTSDVIILNPTKYIHICLSPNINRFPEKFNLIRDLPQDKIQENGDVDASYMEGSGGSLCFSVKTGQSVLENVYGAYQTLKLKEESVLLERVTKSAITRVIQVELGDLPESQKKRKLQEIKNQIEQQLIMNKEAGTIQSRAGAQPIENIIYTTTKNGKGTISTVNIGGDAEIGSIDDVNNSENKMYGSLMVPKALLGADMEGSGLSNGGSLTEMNTTYARRIQRGQVALTSAIKTLINIFAINDGKEIAEKVVNNFTVNLTKLITVEDNRRDELLQSKIRNVNDMMSLVDNIELVDEDTKLNMIIQWLGKYLNQQEIVNILNERIKELEKEENEAMIEEVEDGIDEATEDDGFEFKGGKGGLDGGFDDIPPFEETPELDIPNEEPNLEMPEQENLADIEGEDLL